MHSEIQKIEARKFVTYNQTNSKIVSCPQNDLDCYKLSLQF